MLNIKINISLLLTLFSLSMIEVTAQNHLSSPYSRFGMGEMNKRMSSMNASMGGVSYAFHSPTTINFTNPASYAAFDSLSSIIDATFSYKYHSLQESTRKQSGSTINFDYLSLGFSLGSFWKTAIGFQPYSFINYTINQYTPFNDTAEIKNAFNGTGGIYELYWGNAFKIGKNLSFGLNASYLFGSYNKYQAVEFPDNQFLNFKKDNEFQINGALFSLGAQYFIPIKETFLGLGIVYTPSIPTLYAKKTQYLLTYQNTSYNETIVDSLYWKGTKNIAISLPQTLGGGVSWSSEKYFLGFDFTWTDWSQFEMEESLDTLNDAYKFSLGGSFTPNLTSAKYISKITYSAGYFYEFTSLYLKDRQINKFGINFGFSFPMKKSKTRFNIHFEYGQWGTLQNKLLQERYLLVSFNLALHEKWYQRRILD
jgi:hypothetical protein